jgi:SAM-dependent methyltransferase
MARAEGEPRSDRLEGHGHEAADDHDDRGHEHEHGHGHGHGHGHMHGTFDPEHLLRHEARRRDWMDPAALAGEVLGSAEGVLVDVGAGTGFIALGAASALPRARVVAVDRQADMVALIRRRASEAGLANLEVVQGDAEHLPLPSDSADAVLFSVVLHDLADAAGALAEARRVLRADGRLHVIEFRPGASDQGPPRERLFEPEALAALVEAAGYAVSRRWDGPGPLYRLEARPVARSAAS